MSLMNRSTAMIPTMSPVGVRTPHSRSNRPSLSVPGSGGSVLTDAWSVPPLFQLIERVGGIEHDEMYRVFNMGIGMIVVVAAADLETALDAAGSGACPVGEIVARSGKGEVSWR